MAGFTENLENERLSGTLDGDIGLIKKIFLRDEVLRCRRFFAGGEVGKECAVFYFDGMISSSTLNESVIKPLIDLGLYRLDAAGEDALDTVMTRVLYAADVKKTESLADMLRGMMYGDTLLLVDGYAEGLVIDTKGWERRSVSEPEDEKILEGPREGFNEAVMVNLSLIRRKLQTPDLAIESCRIGRRTDTQVYLCYLSSLAPKRLIKEVKRRLERLDLDGILDTNYIAELTSGRGASLFRTSGSTERPDVVAARLLEGRAALVVDGSPMVLTFPYLFCENFQSDEDYYTNFLTAAVGRMLRYFCFFLSISLPAVYVALTVFHRRLLPTDFLLTLAAAREGVPFSSGVECIALIIIFEILKEAGVRTQQSLGTALSIVGGLVVGQAAVEAKIVSAPMLIIVALSGIGGLMVPRLRGAVFYIRIGLAALASLLGLYGCILGLAVVLVAIISLSSYGFDATPALGNPCFATIKDTFFRAPLWRMKTRPPITTNRIRMKYMKKEDAPYEDEDIQTPTDV